jgi:hypothetical protein
MGKHVTEGGCLFRRVAMRAAQLWAKWAAEALAATLRQRVEADVALTSSFALRAWEDTLISQVPHLPLLPHLAQRRFDSLLRFVALVLCFNSSQKIPFCPAQRCFDSLLRFFALIFLDDSVLSCTALL